MEAVDHHKLAVKVEAADRLVPEVAVLHHKLAVKVDHSEEVVLVPLHHKQAVKVAFLLILDLRLTL